MSKKFSRSLLAAVLSLGGLMLGAPLSQAQYIWNTNVHGDIGIEWEADEGSFHPHWHIGASEYDADAAIARGTPNVYSISGFTGILGTSQGLAFFGSGYAGPSIGFGSEGLEEGDWVNNTVRLTLTGFSGPGQLALVENDPIDGWFSYLSTYENKLVLEFDHLPIHEHFDWVFSAYGTYDLTFTWEAEHVTQGVITASDTFTVQVVPEPTSAMLLGLGAGVLVVLRRRRQRTA
jgi:surface-anchored protein